MKEKNQIWRGFYLAIAKKNKFWRGFNLAILDQNRQNRQILSMLKFVRIR